MHLLRHWARRVSGAGRVRPGRPPGRPPALLAIFAILLQAAVFAWHHHPLPPAAGHQAGSVVHNQTGPASPLAADESCDICQTLHHQSAAPGELLALAVPPSAEDRTGAAFEQPVRGGCPAGFSARAPPSA